MVAIKRTLAALPFLLAVASKVAGQQFTDGDDLAVRADFADNHALLETRDEDIILVERGSGKSKIDKSKIGKPTNTKGTHPVTIPDKDLKSGQSKSGRPVSSSSGYIPIALDPKLRKGKRSIYRRGNGKSKIDKSKIAKPTNAKGTHPVTIPDKDLKSGQSKSGRPVSSSSGYIPIALDPKLRKGKRSIYRRGNGKSKIDKSKIGKPTNPKGTHPITMSDKDLKSSKKRPVSTTSSNGDPFYLEKYIKKGKRDFDFDYYLA
ncbi:unnamed protein product [Clonostachys rhizophaga]|uniref:Uncharacterized protein n=1 Tax=Clonostachys rhizophaga TaxID=160324 RepID=A0A9N9VRW5_9HYPO|nr:unnamed protein product [Clonostachys rhizophaga]